MSGATAIDTLRTAIGEWAGHDETDPAFAPEWAALADVEALLRAAEVLYRAKGIQVSLEDQGAWGDFAAAVRNVKRET